jgi:glycosyltransferase involved in cell wall biosynthesis
MAERFVEQSVNSVLIIPEVKEVILVEDGSSDQSLKICRSLAALHTCIRLIQHPNGVNKGASASRNLGIQHASMPYIAFLDADDIYIPNRFTKDKLIFNTYPDVDGTYNATGSHILEKSASSNFDKSGLKSITTVRKELQPEELCRSLMGITQFHGYFTVNSVTLRRESLNKLPYLFDDQLMMHEDSDFVFRLSYYLKLYPSEIKQPTCSRGIHETNRITHTLNTHQLANQSKFYLWRTLSDWSVKYEIAHDILQHCNRMKNIYKLLTLKEPDKSTTLRGLYREDPAYLQDIRYLRWLHYDRYGQSFLSKLILHIRYRFNKMYQ